MTHITHIMTYVFLRISLSINSILDYEICDGQRTAAECCLYQLATPGGRSPAVRPAAPRRVRLTDAPCYAACRVMPPCACGMAPASICSNCFF